MYKIRRGAAEGMYVIGNGRLITRDKENHFYDDGAVAVDGRKIVDVNTTDMMKKLYPEADFIDAHKGMIMPGLINCHNHIYSAMARGLSIIGYSPKGFLDILDGMWWTIDRKLLLNQTRMSAAATYIDCIKNGVTSIFDHHASYGEIHDSLFVIAEEAKRYGIRSCLCYEVSDRDGEEKCNEAIEENLLFIKEAEKEENRDMLAGMMGLHASFTLSDRTLDKIAGRIPEGTGYHIHVAEGIDDLYDSLKKYGKRIIDRLMDMNILGPRTIAGHCIYINGHEMELLKETETMVVHNPESNMGNAVGCPPTLEIIKHGVLTGLGTDGYTNDMFESMKVANILHKHNLCDPTVAWNEIPQMLYYNNAKIAERFFSDHIGVIEKNALADIIVLDYNPLTPMNSDNINGHLLFGVNGRNVVTTMASGRLLMQDRELKGIDEEAIMRKCREETCKLWKSINN